MSLLTASDFANLHVSVTADSNLVITTNQRVGQGDAEHTDSTVQRCKLLGVVTDCDFDGFCVGLSLVEDV